MEFLLLLPLSELAAFAFWSGLAQATPEKELEVIPRVTLNLKSS
jgi:hypothetical protein